MLASNETIVKFETFECECCGNDKPACDYSDGYDNVPDCDDCIVEYNRQAEIGCAGYDGPDDFDDFQEWCDNVIAGDVDDCDDWSDDDDCYN
jgi:hypothetical protein